MKKTKNVLLIFALMLTAIYSKSQIGSCGNPKALTDGTCTAQDTFNLAPL